jgi:agmatine deiminase
LCAGFLACQPPETETRAEEHFVFPAEFEPQESIWMAWPTYENKRGRPTEPVHMEIIRVTEGHVKIDLLAQDESEISEIRTLFEESGVPHSHVRFHAIPHADIWMRDMGPIFLRGNRGSLKIADFKFNIWGYEAPDSEASKQEERIDRVIAAELGLPTVESKLISEGGNRELNGKGTMMIVEAVARQRNPAWSNEEIERELMRVLGQKKVLWLKEGMAEDELTFRGPLPGGVFTVITTGGHIDELARFADPHTILLAEVTKEEAERDPIAAISRERLETNYEILKRATDQDGEPFRIIRMPVPVSIFETMQAGDGVFDYIQPLEYEDGTVIEPDEQVKVVAAASYLNFHITNGLVLMQAYWEPGRPESLKLTDRDAQRILGEVFPDREVVPIHALNVNLGGGGIHCILQQQPAIQ